MTKLPPILLLAPLALLALQPHAQQSKTKIGLVNVQTVVASMPSGSSFVALSKKADADIMAQSKSVQALLTKARARTATTADKAAYTTAAKAYQTTSQNYQKQLATLFAPLATRVNTAVASVAKANGYSVVLDQRIARDTGLVIYANVQAIDLTSAVTAKVKAGK